MPGGRPRKPVALKKLQGTYNVTRDREQENLESVVAESSIIMDKDSSLPVPKSVTDPAVKKFWREEVSNLLTLRVLSRVDIHQLETMCVTLQKLREVQAKFSAMSVEDKNFDYVEKLFERLGKRFDELAAKFYITPAARTALKLNDIALMKAAKDLEREASPVESLLNNRQ